MEIIDLTVDIGDRLGLNEPAHIALTVHLPDPEKVPSPAVVCFAKPGAGFTRRYFTTDLPGPARGSQAQWHAERGWVFVSVDHLGVGESSTHHDPAGLDLALLAAANEAAERVILEQLEAGDLAAGFPPVESMVQIGIGQSMGGCLTVVQQGRYHCYDGIAVLGFSAVRILPPSPPGHGPIVAAWRVPARESGSPPLLLNEQAFTRAFRDFHGTDPSPGDVLANSTPAASLWHYYYDDVLEYLPAPEATARCPWVSATVPGLITSILTPGIIAPEAAAVAVPVLVAVGERDVVVDLPGEPRAYLSSPSIDLFRCPRMGHMHNFAGTREAFWQRIQGWGQWVAEDACPD